MKCKKIPYESTTDALNSPLCRVLVGYNVRAYKCEFCRKYHWTSGGRFKNKEKEAYKENPNRYEREANHWKEKIEKNENRRIKVKKLRFK